jgi:hypothetical protein
MTKRGDHEMGKGRRIRERRQDEIRVVVLGKVGEEQAQELAARHDTSSAWFTEPDEVIIVD